MIRREHYIETKRSNTWIYATMISVAVLIGVGVLLAFLLKDKILKDDSKTIDVKKIEYYAQFQIETQSIEDVEVTITAQSRTNKSKYVVDDYDSIERIKSDRNTTKYILSVDLNKVVEGITSSDLKELVWSIRFEDLKLNNKVAKISNVIMKDKKLGLEYTDNLNAQSTLDGNYTEYNMNPYTYQDTVEDNTIKVNLVADKYSPIDIGSKVKLRADVLGKDAGLSFQFGAIRNGENIQISKAGSTKELDWTPDKAGYYNVYVEVKNKDGYSIKKYLFGYCVEGLKITDVKTNVASPQEIGKSIIINTKVKNEIEKNGATKYSYSVIDSNSNRFDLKTESDNTAIWTPEKRGKYKLEVSVANDAGQYDTKTLEFRINTPKAEFAVLNLTSDGDSSQMFTGNKLTLLTDFDGGKSPYKFTYGYKKNSEDIIIGETDKDSFEWKVTENGNINFFVIARDSNGKVSRKDTSISVETVQIKEICMTNLSPQKIGTAIGLKPLLNIDTNQCTENRVKYIITNKDSGKTETMVGVKETKYRVTWVPDVAGIYTIDVIYTSSKGRAEKTVTYSIVEGPDKTIIYYKGIATPYLYYQLDDSAWVNKPGVPLEKTTEMSGFTHKIEIDMTNNFVIKAYFGDGLKDIDTNKMPYVTFGKGTYSYFNGVITEINSDLINNTDGINYVKIYYKGFANKIHYTTGGGWTTAPGEDMVPSDNELYTKNGYKLMVKIELGMGTKLRCDFNDGSSNWDDNNKADYFFSPGTYLYESPGDIVQVPNEE